MSTALGFLCLCNIEVMQHRKPNTFIAIRRPGILEEIDPLLWKSTVAIVVALIMAMNVFDILEKSISSWLLSCLSCSMSPLTLHSCSHSSSSSLDLLPPPFPSWPWLTPDVVPSPPSWPGLPPNKLPLLSPTRSWLAPDLLLFPSASQHSLPPIPHYKKKILVQRKKPLQ